MGVEIFISINNNEEVIQLPTSPESYGIDSPWKNETFEGMKIELNLIGLRGLKTIEISSFFPIRDYPFIRNRDMWGKEYVEAIERWRDRRVPIRLIIVSDDPHVMGVNMPVTIDNFEHKTKQDGDIYYTLSFKEFAFVKVGG
jgi:hypothetical protein